MSGAAFDSQGEHPLRDEAGADHEVLALFTSSGAADPHPVYRHLREVAVASLDTGMGTEPVVLISRYEDVHHALRHPEIFSSAEDPIDLGTPRRLIPLQVDPPNHARYRRMLDPLFGPKAVDAMEGEVRALARRLLDGLTDRGSCDFHTEFAVPFPCTIFLQLMGLPVEDLEQFLAWKDGIIRPEVHDPWDPDATKAAREEAGRAIDSYFEAAIDERLSDPRNDLLTLFVNSDVGGEALDREELLGMCYLFLLGGLDTVTASLDCTIARLATHPEERRRLVADPSLLPAAIEELLRFETPVAGVPRMVTKEVTIGDRHLSPGTRVMVMLGAADTDERVFDEADKVDFDRVGNRHFAFSSGPHRCLGSHLARRELRVALEEWHSRFPEYSVAPGSTLAYTPGIRQIDPLPLVFPKSQA